MLFIIILILQRMYRCVHIVYASVVEIYLDAFKWGMSAAEPRLFSRFIASGITFGHFLAYTIWRYYFWINDSFESRESWSQPILFNGFGVFFKNIQISLYFLHFWEKIPKSELQILWIIYFEMKWLKTISIQFIFFINN